MYIRKIRVYTSVSTYQRKGKKKRRERERETRQIFFFPSSSILDACLLCSFVPLFFFFSATPLMGFHHPQIQVQVIRLLLFDFLLTFACCCWYTYLWLCQKQRVCVLESNAKEATTLLLQLEGNPCFPPASFRSIDDANETEDERRIHRRYEVTWKSWNSRKENGGRLEIVRECSADVSSSLFHPSSLHGCRDILTSGFCYWKFSIHLTKWRNSRILTRSWTVKILPSCRKKTDNLFLN